MKTPERSSGVFIDNFEQIVQIFLVFSLLTFKNKKMLAGRKLVASNELLAL